MKFGLMESPSESYRIERVERSNEGKIGNQMCVVGFLAVLIGRVCGRFCCSEDWEGVFGRFCCSVDWESVFGRFCCSEDWEGVCGRFCCSEDWECVFGV